MRPHQAALVVLVTAGLIATGCGTEDTETNSDVGGQPDAAEVEPESKPKSARAQMVECIEGVGYKVISEHDDPNNLSVNSPNGTLEAVVIVHPSDAAAAKSAAQGRDKDDLDAAAYGRAELVLHAAKETEARVIASCVADEYDRDG